MFDKWFLKQSKLLKIILLLIPGVNWIVEILVRIFALIRKPCLMSVLGFIIALIPTGVILGWLDLIWVLLFDRLFMQVK